MATIQHGAKAFKVKLNKEFDDFTNRKESNDAEAQWTEQISNESGDIIVDVSSGGKKLTRSYELVVDSDAAGIGSYGETLVGGVLSDDGGLALGKIVKISEATEAGRSVVLTVSVEAYDSVVYTPQGS